MDDLSDAANEAGKQAPAGAHEADPQAASSKAPAREPAPWVDLALPLAALGLLAWTLTRVSSGLRGAAVGIGWLIEATDFVARFSSYGFALAGSGFALAATGLLARSSIAAPVRFGSIPLVGLIVWAATAAAFTRLPVIALFFSGGAAVLLTSSLAVAALSRSSDRAGTIVLWMALGAGAVGGLRLAAAWVGTSAAEELDADRFALARTLATGGTLVLLALGVSAVIGMEACRVVARGAPRDLVRLPTLWVVVSTALLVRAALGADAEDASVLAVLCRRTLDLLGSRPVPTRGLLRLAAHAVVLCVPFAALAERRVRPTVRASAALLLAGASAPDRPLGALLLAVGGCVAALAALDREGVWKHLARMSHRVR